MLARSVITKSGQLWKLLTCLALIIIGGISMCWGQSHLDTNYGGWLLASGMVAVFGALIFACVGIRCPSCGAKWFWLAVNRQASNKWLNWLLTQSACPECKGEFHSAGT